MENASKALIIAGSILVAIMIVSLGIMIFNNFSSSVRNDANMDEQEIAEFNSSITPYVGNAVTGSQVNALIQRVISTNIAAGTAQDSTKSLRINYEYQDGATTKSNEIYLDASTFEVKYSNTDVPKRVPTGAGKYYSVKVEEYGSDGLIEKITVKQNP